jgi:hypothetical protein
MQVKNPASLRLAELRKLHLKLLNFFQPAGFFTKMLRFDKKILRNFSEISLQLLKSLSAVNSAISNAISSAGRAWARLNFFPVIVHDRGFQKWYVTLACRAVPACESVFKTPKYTAKKLQSRSHFTLPPFSPLGKIFYFMRIFF